jgi:hypothetical protein
VIGELFSRTVGDVASMRRVLPEVDREMKLTGVYNFAGFQCLVDPASGKLVKAFFAK